MIRLYPVEPQGLGTPDVESLSSYLLRVAEAHSTSVGVLLRTLCDQDGYSLHVDISRVHHAPIATLVRPNETTVSATVILSQALHTSIDDLVSMTMLPLSPALPRLMYVFAPYFRWCTACVREQKKSLGVIYFKLIWMFSQVTVCPDHLCTLEDRCPTCHRHQKSVARRHSIGTCAYCCADLDTIVAPAREPSDQTKAAEELVNIVAYLAANPGIKIPRRGFFNALSELEEESFHAHSESLFKFATEGRGPHSSPTLSNLLRVSEILRVPAINLLLGDVAGTNLSLISNDKIDTPKRGQRRRGPWRDRREVEAKAWTFFNSSPTGIHPSLTEVARHVRMSPSGFRYVCPKFARDIVETWRREKILRREERAASLACKLRELVAPHVSIGIGAVGRKHLVYQLWREGNWSKNMIREAVDRAFEVLERCS